MGGTGRVAIGAGIVLAAASACFDTGGGGGGGGCGNRNYARVPCKVDSDCHQTVACVETFCDQGLCAARGPGDTLPADVSGDCKKPQCDGPNAVFVLDPNDAPPAFLCAHAYCTTDPDNQPAVAHRYDPDGTPCGYSGADAYFCTRGQCRTTHDAGHPQPDAGGDAMDDAATDASQD